jgi:hypothetical protein
LVHWLRQLVRQAPDDRVFHQSNQLALIIITVKGSRRRHTPAMYLRRNRRHRKRKLSQLDDSDHA